MSAARTAIARDRATARREPSAVAAELATVAEFVRARPLSAIMVAASAGFIFNGGMTSRAGRAFTAFVVPIVLRAVVTDAIVSSITADHDRRTVPENGRTR